MVLQVMLTEFAPSHSFPPKAASVVLFLVRNIDPNPQEVEQLAFFHSPQTQSTKAMKEDLELA